MARRQELASWESAGNKHVGLDRRPQHARHTVIAEAVARHTPPNGTVLDFGCGMGQTSEAAQRNRPDLVFTLADAYQSCLDSSADHVSAAHAVLLEEDGFDVDAFDEQFDTVILSHVLEHALDPVGAALSILSLLKPGGVAIFAVPNPARPKVLFYGARRFNYANRGHVVAWDPSHWRVFLESVLRVEVIEYLADEVQLLPPRLVNRSRTLRRFERFLARPLPWWSFSNIAVVRPAAG